MKTIIILFIALCVNLLQIACNDPTPRFISIQKNGKFECAWFKAEARAEGKRYVKTHKDDIYQCRDCKGCPWYEVK